MIQYIFCLIEAVFGYILPIYASFHVLGAKQENSAGQTRWLIHWVLLAILFGTLFPVLKFIGLDSYLSAPIVGALFFVDKFLPVQKVQEFADLGLKIVDSKLDLVRGIIKGLAEKAKEICGYK